MSIETSKKKKGIQMPHTYIILFLIVLVVCLLTYVIPAGQFERQEDASGRMLIVPGTYTQVESSPVSPLEIPMAFVRTLRLLYQSNDIFPRIFIACANNRSEIAKALPHWTLNEFLTQIEHFMGIVVEVDELTKSSRILARSQWYDNDNPTIISDVVDEYTVEVDKQETSDISNGNVGWSDIGDSMAHISDDIMEVATIDSSTFKTLDDMKQYIIFCRLNWLRHLWRTHTRR